MITHRIGQVWTPRRPLGGVGPLGVVVVDLHDPEHALVVNGGVAGAAQRAEVVAGAMLDCYFDLSVQESISGPEVTPARARAWAILLDVRTDVRVQVLDGCDGLADHAPIVAALRYVRALAHARERATFRALDRVAGDVQNFGVAPNSAVAFCGSCLDLDPKPIVPEQAWVAAWPFAVQQASSRPTPQQLDNESIAAPKGQTSVGLGVCGLCFSVSPLYEVTA